MSKRNDDNTTKFFSAFIQMVLNSDSSIYPNGIEF